MSWIERLESHRTKMEGQPFFKTYSRRPWVPISEEAAKQFFTTMVNPSGPIILHDFLDLVDKFRPEIMDDVESDLQARSVYTPDMIRDKCLKFEEGGKMGQYDTVALAKAVSKVHRMYKTSKVTPRSIDNLPELQGSKNAGLPWLVKKQVVWNELLRDANAILDGTLRPQPFSLFHRGKDETVARFVNAGAGAIQAVEATYFYPVFHELIKHSTPYAGALKENERAAVIDNMRATKDYILELDYSNFDGSISGYLISLAFDILRQNLEFEDDRQEFGWDVVVEHFITGPFLAPDGYVYYGRRHGVPSGSMFTQLIDSIVNCICIEYLKIRLRVGTSRYLVMGDDVVVGVSHQLDVIQAAEALAELGIIVNTKKSDAHPSTQRPHFLGHNWGGPLPTRDIVDLVRRIATPERRDPRIWGDYDERNRYLAERLFAYMDESPTAECWELLFQILDHIQSIQVLGPHFKYYFYQKGEVESFQDEGRRRYDFRYSQAVSVGKPRVAAYMAR